MPSDFASVHYDFLAREVASHLDSVYYSLGPSHISRSKQLITAIFLGITGMVPLAKQAILNRKVPNITLIQSLPLFNRTLIVPGIICTLFSLGVGAILLMKQVASLRAINQKIQGLKDIGIKKLGVGFQNEFLVKTSPFKTLKSAPQEKEKIAPYLQAVVDPDNYHEIHDYPVPIITKFTLLQDSVSLFLFRSCIKNELIAKNTEKEESRVRAWRELLKNALHSNKPYPREILECIAAVSLPYSFLAKKSFELDTLITLEIDAEDDICFIVVHDKTTGSQRNTRFDDASDFKENFLNKLKES